MPYIIIENLNNIKLPADMRANNVLEIIHGHYIDWMHACGGKGKCTTCKMQVLNGWENLSELTSFEVAYIQKNRLQQNERLSCQTKLLGDIVIKVPDTGKLPHMKYNK